MDLEVEVKKLKEALCTPSVQFVGVDREVLSALVDMYYAWEASEPVRYCGSCASIVSQKDKSCPYCNLALAEKAE